MTKQRSEKQLVYDRVMEAFQSEFPPDVPWNRTIWNQQLGVLKRALFSQGYTPDEVIDAIRYAKLQGKQVRSLAFIPYVIEQSKQYWTQIREREEEQHKRMEQEYHPPEVAQPKSNTPSWLGNSEFGEVD